MDDDTSSAGQDGQRATPSRWRWGFGSRDASRRLRTMEWARAQPPFHDSDFEPEPWSVPGPLAPAAGQ